MSARRVPYLQRMIALGFVTALLWLLFAPNSPIVAGDARTRAELDALRSGEAIPRPRLASTSPAMTDTLVELGLAAHIVGRSPYCRSVPRSVPVVGDLRDFDAERLGLARPDALFVQPPLAGVDPALESFCRDAGIELVAQRMDSFRDTAAFVGALAELLETSAPPRGLSAPALEGSSPSPESRQVSARIAAAVRELGELVDAAGPRADQAASEAARPKVVLLVSSEPFLAVGRTNYLDEMLRSVGLANAIEREGWIELSAESLLAIAPTTVLGVGESPDGARRIEESVRALPWNTGSEPAVAARALPEILSPSLAAARRRGELRKLLDAAHGPNGADGASR